MVLEKELSFHLNWDNMTQKDWENTETTKSYIEVMVVEYGEGLLDELLGSTEEEKIRVCTNEDFISEEWNEFQDRNDELDISPDGEKYESYGDFVREYLYEKIDDYKDARINHLSSDQS